MKKRTGTEYFPYLVSFLLPVLILLTLFGLKGIYPFGDRSFLFGDLYHQYMPFFSEFLHKLRAGEGLGFSWNVGIGSNFLALYVYYLASPFHWLALLVQESHLLEFISYLVIIKSGLMGVSFCWYMQKHFLKNDITTALFSCFYALSGFMAAYNYNIMWLDCVILLPLIVLGLERLVQEGKCGLYCITLGLSIFTNYYISIMICIFLVLYFVVLLLCSRGKNLLRSVGYFAWFSLLAGGMAAVLLIPEVCAILQTDFGDMDFPQNLKFYFSVLDMLSRHCISVSAERGLNHWPNIYCGSMVFLLLPLYAVNQGIAIRERFCRLAVMGIFLLSFSINYLDFIWHGMNYPDSLPARQSFLYIFMVLAACYDVLVHCKEIEKKQILYGYLGAVAFLLFCQKFVEQEAFTPGVELLTLLFVTIYAVMLYFYRNFVDNTGRKPQTGILLLVFAFALVVTETGINMYNTSLGTVSRSNYLGQQEDYASLYAWSREQETGFYRMEKFTRKTKNDGTLTGYPTASVFSSTMNSQVMDFFQRLGMRHSKVYYGYDGATALTAAMLNVKYMFGESALYENELYQQAAQSGEIVLYQAENTLPFGYVAPLEFDLPQGYTNNGIALQNKMVQELGAEGELFEEAESRKSGEDVTFTAQKSGIYYAMLTASGTNKIEAIGVQTGSEHYNDLKTGSILYLGYVEQGKTVTLTNEEENDDTPTVSASVYWMDEAVLQEALEILSRQHLEQVSYSDDWITGRITLSEAGRLILSVPLEKGWQIWINGEKTEAVSFGGCLVAFDLPAGEYTLEMKYVPQGLGAGIAVTISSILLFVLSMLLLRKRQKPAASTLVGGLPETL